MIASVTSIIYFRSCAVKSNVFDIYVNCFMKNASRGGFFPEID